MFKRVVTLSTAASATLLAACSGNSSSETAAESDPTEVAATSEREAEKTIPAVTVKELDADSTIDVGLEVGAQAPLGLSFKTTDAEVTLDEIVKEKPVVIVFTRSLEWCPFCQTQFKGLNGIVGDLEERGYGLYGVSYDSPDKQDRFAANQVLEYQLLSDEPSAAIDAFGVRDPQYTEGRAVGVPYASVFVLNQQGTVTAKLVSGDYKKRPTNEQLLSFIDSI